MYSSSDDSSSVQSFESEESSVEGHIFVFEEETSESGEESSYVEEVEEEESEGSWSSVDFNEILDDIKYILHLFSTVYIYF